MSGPTSTQSHSLSDHDFVPLELVYAEEWAIDILERILINDHRGAVTSHSLANLYLLKLPPGSSYAALEDFLQVLGVKLFHNQGSNTP
jgi:hypothetical protein